MPRSFIAGRRDRQLMETAMYSRDELDQIHAEWNEDCMDYEDDGQPDEQQEWEDFDRGC